MSLALCNAPLSTVNASFHEEGDSDLTDAELRAAGARGVLGLDREPDKLPERSDIVRAEDLRLTKIYLQITLLGVAKAVSALRLN